MNKMVCPIDCPNRCASPNCHNVNTCETWAKHEAEIEAERERRHKRNRAIEDTRKARSRYRNSYDRDFDKNGRRKR